MVNDPNCGNPQSRTESTQKVRKLSKLSLTGFILSILSVCLLVLLRLPVKMQGDLRIALSICLYFSFTAALICSITGLILSSNGKDTSILEITIGSEEYMKTGAKYE